MSFLDNLESNLKALESREEAQDQRERQNRAGQRAEALAAAPWAEKLKKAPFTEELLRQATRLGYAGRVKVRPTWIGTTLRLEAGTRRLELRPTAGGVLAVFLEEQKELTSQPVNLDGNAETLAHQWLNGPAEAPSI